MSFLVSQMRSRAVAATSTTSVFSRNFTTTSPRSLARISLIGRLAAEPELKQSSSSSANEYITYTIGTSTGPRDAQGNRATSWFRVANFNAPAEGSRARDYLLGIEKGTLVYVEGDASMSTYTDKDSGKNLNSLNIVQRNLEVLRRPQSHGSEGEIPS